MRVLDAEETRWWWEARPGLGREGDLGVRARVDANFESRQMMILGFASTLAYWLGGQGKVVVSVFECGIWMENWELFNAWRKAHGEMRSLEEAPGHEFTAEEIEPCTSMLQLGLSFGWGLSCGCEESGRAFHVNHDGHGLVVGPDAGDIGPIVETLVR
jgi:hypothetical protein